MPIDPKQSGQQRVDADEQDSATELSTSDIHCFTLRLQKKVLLQVDEAVAKHPVIRNRIVIGN